jgi:hypothetical protein
VTPDEHRRLEEVEEMVREMHRKLFTPGDDGDPPLISRIMTVVKAAENGQWAAKWIMRLLFGVLTFLGAAVALWKQRGL